MPLSINVGLSRKASKDYQSTGVSINVTAELDQSLLARPEELQQQIASLSAQAEQALDRRGVDPGHAPTQSQPSRRPASQATSKGGGNGNGSTRPSRGGGMTESQRRAINAIAN